ncbi:MAG: hypothetical protein ABSC51_08695 [Gaiellaceae bacterium]
MSRRPIARAKIILSLPPRSSLFCAVFVILALSGVGLIWNGPPAPHWSANGVEAEYRSEARQLTLAPGWGWPAELGFDPGTPAEPMHYKAGFGAGQADSRWFCSWATRALAESLPARARRAALEQLATTLRNSALLEGMPPGEREYPKLIVAEALRGKPSDLRQSVSEQCYVFDKSGRRIPIDRGPSRS